MRKILHIDMDAFYASVEQRDNPSLRGRPVVVAWETQRSVVCAASYEARKFGVHSAMPASRARRLCPEAVFVAPDFERYRAVTKQIREVFERHTPLVEFLSLDEAYLDVTEELTGIATATEAAQVIRAEVKEETKLTASAGVAPNKFLAKIASDWRKPDGLFVIKPHQVDTFLAPLPVGKIPGVGKATEKLLHDAGYTTMGELREPSREALIERFGKFGGRLWELARGIDESPVVPSRRAKQVSSENTFREDVTIEEVREYIVRESDKVWEHCASRGRVPRTVTVKLRAGDFTTATRQTTLSAPPTTSAEIAAAAADLLGRFTFSATTRYRLAGVSLSKFMDEEEEGEQAETPQPALFSS